MLANVAGTLHGATSVMLDCPFHCLPDTGHKALCPVSPVHTGMFNAGMLSINGTTADSVAANMRDQSILQLRMDNTTAGADMGGGTAGLLGFSQKMTQSDEVYDTKAEGYGMKMRTQCSFTL